MSLGDELRYLRALRGGPALEEVEAAIEVPRGTMWKIEQRYRRMGEDDDLLARLADYYAVPLADLQFHRERYRKALSAVLHAAQKSGAAASFRLRTGETVHGRVTWWDLASFGLQVPGQPLIVVQRHAVIDWEGSE
ncbi:MAG: hypothetical protein JXD18_12380 [Anaerolineae bacterium]|nr:hypothetical protein [Anaerolineae bacterium]